MRRAAALGGRSLLGRARRKGSAIAALSGLILFLAAPTALAECPLTDPECATRAVEQTTKTVTDTTGSAGDTVNGTVDPVKDKADNEVNQVTDAVDGILNPGGGGGPGGGGRTGGHRKGTGSGGRGGPGAVSWVPIPGVPQPGSVGSTATSFRSGQVTRRPNGPSLVGRVGAAVAEAARQVAFPLALVLVVVAFLLVQNRLDRRDPKLALSPIVPDVMMFA